MIKLHNGDCFEVLKTMPDNSVDAVITDPPYGMQIEIAKARIEHEQSKQEQLAFEALPN